MVQSDAEASTVRCYDRIAEPVLIVVGDLSVDSEPVDCPLNYAWVRDKLRRISIADLDPEQACLTLRVPVSNRPGAQNELAQAGLALSVVVERTRAGINEMPSPLAVS